jgi:hypothetical protein
LPKWPENCFEPFGKGGWPPISTWITYLPCGLKEDVSIWSQSMDLAKRVLHDEAFKKIILEKWCHSKSKDKESTKGLFPYGTSILLAQGFIHKQNIIVSINPSFLHNFINVQLVNRLQVLAMNIQSILVEGENIQICKYLKLSMDKYVLHSYFYVIDMDDVDIVFGYPWIDSVGTININVQKKFFKL